MSTFPVVGIITMIVGTLVFLLLLGPVPAPDVPIHFAMGGFLVVIGATMFYFGGKSERNS